MPMRQSLGSLAEAQCGHGGAPGDKVVEEDWVWVAPGLKCLLRGLILIVGFLS